MLWVSYRNPSSNHISVVTIFRNFCFCRKPLHQTGQLTIFLHFMDNSKYFIHEYAATFQSQTLSGHSEQEISDHVVLANRIHLVTVGRKTKHQTVIPLKAAKFGLKHFKFDSSTGYMWSLIPYAGARSDVTSHIRVNYNLKS